MNPNINMFKALFTMPYFIISSVNDQQIQINYDKFKSNKVFISHIFTTFKKLSSDKFKKVLEKQIKIKL